MARESVVSYYLSEYSFTLPHSLENMSVELRLVHLSLH